MVEHWSCKPEVPCSIHGVGIRTFIFVAPLYIEIDSNFLVFVFVCTTTLSHTVADAPSLHSLHSRCNPCSCCTANELHTYCTELRCDCLAGGPTLKSVDCIGCWPGVLATRHLHAGRLPLGMSQSVDWNADVICHPNRAAADDINMCLALLSTSFGRASCLQRLRIIRRHDST